MSAALPRRAPLRGRGADEHQRRANGVNGGVFVLSRVEDDEYRLDYGWFEYGAMDLGRATVHELGRRAEKIARPEPRLDR